MSKKVLITGYAGQDGKCLVRRLKEKEYELFGIDVVPGPDGVKRIDFGRGSIEDMDLLRFAVGYHGIDEIYHLAAITSPGIGVHMPYKMLEVNVIGTLNVLEAARYAKRDMKVLYMASDNVFGEHPDVPQNEDTSWRPADFYGVTKATGLMLAEVYRKYGVDVRCIIPFNHSSAEQGDGFLLGHVAKEIVRLCLQIKQKAGWKPVVMRMRNSKRDFLHAEDVVDAMVTVMESGESGNYVVGSGETRTVEEIVWISYKKAIKLLGLKEAPHFDCIVSFESDGDDGMYPKAYPRKLQRLGWFPKWTFEKLVETMVYEEIVKQGFDVSQMPD